MLHFKVISKTMESQAVLNQCHELGRKAALEDEVQKKEELLDQVRWVWKKAHTPLKFNMEPENGGLEDDFPFQLGAF